VSETSTPQFEKEQSTRIGEVEKIEDPFAPENVARLQLVVSMRIYDALMALLSTQDDELAEQLGDIHALGQVVGNPPGFTGFYTPADKV
jgi:hypothetical protein